MMAKFDEKLYKCKAVCLEDDKTIICGFYCHSEGRGMKHSIWFDEYDSEAEDYYPNLTEVNPYTVCRNTGIKLKDGAYLYEYDLVEYWNGLKAKQLGYIAWDDYALRYRIRTSANYSSALDINGMDINVVGNVVLCKDDSVKFQAYSDKEEQRSTPDVKVECRSTQRLNRQAKIRNHQGQGGNRHGYSIRLSRLWAEGRRG